MNISRINCGFGYKTYLEMRELYVEALTMPDGEEGGGNNLELCVGIPCDNYCIVQEDRIEVWAENPRCPGENYYTWVVLGTNLSRHPWSPTP